MNQLKALIENAIQESMIVIVPEVAEVILEAIQESSLVDLLGGASHGRSKAATKAPSKAGGGKRVRRSEEEIQAQAAKIPAILRKHKNGAGAEQICEDLGIDRKDVPRLITEALNQKLISKRGEKRGTLYFAGAAKKGASTKSVKKTSKKSAPKKTKKKASKKSSKKVVTKSTNNAIAGALASEE